MFGYFCGNNDVISAPFECPIKVICLKSNSGFDFFNSFIVNRILSAPRSQNGRLTIYGIPIDGIKLSVGSSC